MSDVLSADPLFYAASFSTAQPTEAKKCDEQLSDSYDVLPIIGRGRFAKVCQVRHKRSGEIFAAKFVRRWRSGKDTLRNVLFELQVISLGASSDHIVKMHHYYLDDKEVTIILEHAVGGDLYNLVNFENIILPIPAVQKIIMQLLDALVFLHQYNIVHLDIKPDNVLLRRPYPMIDVALCDFGLAKHLNDEQDVRDLVGTPDYVAPEILAYDPIHLTTDIWSVGVLTYYLLTGVSPFWAPSKDATISNVSFLRISYPDDLFSSVHRGGIHFIQRLLIKDPRKRPSATDCLEDPWFVDEPNQTSSNSVVELPSSPSPSSRIPVV